MEEKNNIKTIENSIKFKILLNFLNKIIEESSVYIEKQKIEALIKVMEEE